MLHAHLNWRHIGLFIEKVSVRSFTSYHLHGRRNLTRKKALATPGAGIAQCLGNKSQEEIIQAYFLYAFHMLVRHKVITWFCSEWDWRLVVRTLNGNLVCCAFKYSQTHYIIILWETARGSLCHVPLIKADTHEGFRSRSMLQGHPPGAKLLHVY